jgi:hypothetical protein
MQSSVEPALDKTWVITFNTEEVKLPLSTTTSDLASIHNDNNAVKLHWRSSVLPSWVQWRPLLGLLALLGASLCMATSLIILVVSDGKTTTSWNVQPTVYLAIASALGAACIRVALSRAAPIAWWRQALDGSTIRSLQNQWEASQGHVMRRTEY